MRLGSVRPKLSQSIGHLWWITTGRQACVAECIDADSEDHPKRMRILHGECERKVVGPSGYQLVKRCDDMRPAFVRTHS